MLSIVNQNSTRDLCLDPPIHEFLPRFTFNNRTKGHAPGKAKDQIRGQVQQETLNNSALQLKGLSLWWIMRHLHLDFAHVRPIRLTGDKAKKAFEFDCSSNELGYKGLFRSAPYFQKRSWQIIADHSKLKAANFGRAFGPLVDPSSCSCKPNLSKFAGCQGMWRQKCRDQKHIQYISDYIYFYIFVYSIHLSLAVACPFKGGFGIVTASGCHGWCQ